MSGAVTNVVFAGAAGQPVLATARLVAEAALLGDLEVTLSEWPAALPGGGSVAVHVRIGAAASPVVSDGQADVLVAFDQLEALRVARWLASGAFAAVNDRVMPTWRMRAGLEARPGDALARLQELVPRAVGVRAEALARRGGGDLLVGVALLGVVSTLLPMPAAALEEALARVGADALERRRVLERGRHLFAALPARLAAPPRATP